MLHLSLPCRVERPQDILLLLGVAQHGKAPPGFDLPDDAGAGLIEQRRRLAGRSDVRHDFVAAFRHCRSLPCKRHDNQVRIFEASPIR
jgi:hypothetical protein